MRRLKILTAVALPTVLAATVCAADPAPSNLIPLAASQRVIGSQPCDPPRVVLPFSGSCPPAVPGMPQPGQPGAPSPDQAPAPTPDAPAPSVAPESSALALSGSSAALGLPNMAGSFSGVSFITNVVNRQTASAPFFFVDAQDRTRISNPVAVPVDLVTRVRAFDASRGTALIAENESPRPQCRVYARYQYFAGVPATAPGTAIPVIDDAALLAAVQAEIARQSVVGGAPIITTPEEAARQVANTVANRVTPEQLTAASRQISNRAVQRQIIGMEAAFLNNIASVGLRVPTFLQSGDGSLGSDDFGDLSAIAKAVIWDDPTTGNLLSGGLVVTAPTGPGIQTVDGTIRSTLFQPYLGMICPITPRLAAQGFSGVVFPTDSRDVTFMTTDLGLLYWLYRNPNPSCLVTAVIPAVEAHIITPFNKRGSDSSPIGLPDIVTFTGALHTVLGNNVVLYGAVVVPVTGPKPFDAEAQAVVDFRF